MKLTKTAGNLAIVTILILFVIFFNSCGGNRTAPETGAVGLYLTDDMSQFKQVIASIEQVSISNTETGASCQLLSVPVTLNVASLSNLMHLVNVADCIPGQYHQIHIELNKSVQLISGPTETTSEMVSLCSFVGYKDEANRSYPLLCNGPLCFLDIETSFDVLSGQSHKLALDFNLKDFDVVNFGDPSSCSITAKVNALRSLEIASIARPELLTGLISNLTSTNRTFTFTYQRTSLTINYSAITAAEQPGLDALLQLAQDNTLKVNVLSTDACTARGTILANNIFVDIQGSALQLNTLNNSFALNFKETRSIPVIYSVTDAYGILSNGAWVEVRLYGNDGQNYMALDPPFSIIPGQHEMLYISNFSSLTDAVAKIGEAQVTLVIDTETTLTADTSMPTNIYMTFIYPGNINQGSYSLSISGGFSAGLYEIFKGIGMVTLGQTQFSYVKWFGNDLQKTFNSLPNGGEIKVTESFSQATAVTVPIGPANTINYRLTGPGRGTIIYFTATDDTRMFSIPGTASNSAGFAVENLWLEGNAYSGDCISGAYLNGNKFRLINVMIHNFGGHAIHLENSYGAYLDSNTWIDNVNLKTGNYAVYLKTCSGFNTDATIESTPRGCLYIEESSFTVGGIIESCGHTHLEIYHGSGEISAYFETTGNDPPNLIYISGDENNISQGISIHGSILTRSSDTTYSPTKAPIFIDYGRGIDITGNYIRPNDGNGNSPHAYVTGNARQVNFGVNRYIGNVFAKPVNPNIYVAPGALDIQFSYMVAKSYLFYKDAVPSNTLGGSLVTNLQSFSYDVPYKSWIVGINVYSFTPITGGTLTVYTNSNEGSGFSQIRALLDANAQSTTGVQQYPFMTEDVVNAGQELKCYFDTSFSMSPDRSMNITVVVEVLEDRSYNQ